MATDFEAAVLRVLADGEDGATTPETVAHALDVDRSVVWEALDRLTVQGLVERRGQSHYGYHLWGLTASGVASLKDDDEGEEMQG